VGKKEAVVRKNGRSGSMNHGNNNKGQKNNESFLDNKQCQGVILEGI
jgi:hypothetical protein